MALTTKGIEAAKPKMDKTTGKEKAVRLADGNGLFWKLQPKASAGGRATSLKVKSRCFPSASSLWSDSRKRGRKTFSCGNSLIRG